MTSDFDEVFMDTFPDLAAEAVSQILHHQDATRFLSWIRDEAPNLFPELFELLDEDECRALAMSLGRVLWNATPLPNYGYRPQPLPKPSRNQPCICGSGRKYKYCCAGSPAMEPIDPEVIWYFVAEHLPVDEIERLTRSHTIPTLALGMIARRLLDMDDPERARRLVEPLFEHPEKLDERHEEALEVLLESYEATYDFEGKAELMDYLAPRLRPPLSSTLWTQVTLFALGEDDFERAWESFHRAQREDPDNPSLALLEMTLLGVGGRFGQVSERARFWQMRLRRQGFESDDPLALFLAKAIRDPVGALLEDETAVREDLMMRFRALIDSLPERPVPEYQLLREAELIEKNVPFLALVPGEGPFVTLHPPDEVRELEGPWSELWPLGDEDWEEEDWAKEDWAKEDWKEEDWKEEDRDEEDWDEEDEKDWERLAAAHDAEESPYWQPPETAEAWLTFLETRPAALDSLSILEDLAIAIRDLPIPRGVLDQTLMGPLVDRSEAIVEAAFRQPGAGRMLWISKPNQPAIALLDAKLELLERHGELEHQQRLRERFLELAPDDRFYHRTRQLHDRLESGDDEKALELASFYPEDIPLPDVLFGRALALFRLERRDEAANAALLACRRLPMVSDFLLHRRQDIPESVHPYMSVLGGEDQAWWYGESAGDLWRESPGAVDWLTAIAEEAAAPESESEDA